MSFYFTKTSNFSLAPSALAIYRYNMIDLFDVDGFLCPYISYVTRWQITLRSSNQSRFLTSRLDCNKVLQCQSSGEEISVRMKIGTFATEDLPKSPFQDLLGSNFWAEICFRSGHPEHQIFKIFLGEDPQTPLSKSETLFENVFDMPPR